MEKIIIQQIRIDKLFGLYSYTLPEKSVFSDAAILYGDNGVGKSTLLRLVYHLLSSAHNRGHRTRLSEIKFEYLEVQLSSGVTISAERFSVEQIGGFIRLDINKEKKVIARWNYPEDENLKKHFLSEDWMVDDKGILRKGSHGKNESIIPLGDKVYLNALTENAPIMFILNADRKLDSDSVADPSDEVELRRHVKYDNQKSINELAQYSREIGLVQALSSASKWISQKAIISTNLGTLNVHSVYTDVVQQLVVGKTKTKSIPSNAKLISRLKEIEIKMNQYTEYELATGLSTALFIESLEADDNSSGLVAELLYPYIESLERRLEAAAPIYKIIDIFVQSINEFLNDKKIYFEFGKGFKIINDFELELETSYLSSGEQQLLLLFCYVITARDKPSVFMIDEPEISLNVKWQRQLIQALLNITKDSNIQFIFASHSIELLAQHSERVVKMENL